MPVIMTASFNSCQSHFKSQTNFHSVPSSTSIFAYMDQACSDFVFFPQAIENCMGGTILDKLHLSQPFLALAISTE